MRTTFFTCMFHPSDATKLVVKLSNQMAMTEFIPPHENVGWIIFIAFMIVIATGIIQLYLAFRRKRTENPPLPPPPPPPLPPPVEAPGHDELALALPDKIYILPTGHVYHINDKCFKGGKEYSLCKICKRKNDDAVHLHLENIIQGSATRRASSSH